MPATSTAQRRAIAIAEHHPGQLYKRNKGLLRMSMTQLHDFAHTKERGLPHYAKGKNKGHKMKHRMTHVPGKPAYA